jgi:CelD/BcsL family acetyltransferase involved in cellulose biosynthesis
MSRVQSAALPRQSPAWDALGSAGQRTDLKIEVVDNVATFAGLRDEWNELLAASRSDSLFLTWEWVHSWWMHHGHARRLFIVTVRSGSQLIAIAPLTLRRAWVGPFAVPLLEFAGTGSICSDYLDFIVRSDWEIAATTLAAFLDEIGLTLRLPGVKEDSWVATLLSQSLVDRGWECSKEPLEVCPFIDLSGVSWDDYLSSLGPRHRYNFRRRSRNLEKDYVVCLDCPTSDQERRNALKDLANLHRLRWLTRRGSNAFNSTGFAFHDQLSGLAMEKGWLRLFVMRLDGKAVAALYGFFYGGIFHFFQSGFDPEFGSYSVGLVMLGLTIRAAIAEGAAEYDLLRGSEAYKFLWANRVRTLLRLELYSPRGAGPVQRMAAHTRKFVKRVFRAASTPLSANRTGS